jgi:peptidoglycan/xylan/chitin deacetylase (PgdA/CDA1 family)
LLTALVAAACAPVEPEAPAPLVREYTFPEEAEEAVSELALAPPPLPPVHGVLPEIITSVPRAGRKIALTFDACPSKATTPYDARITKVLAQTQTPATLFLSGAWAQREMKQVKELAVNPLIEIANHSFTHPHMRRVPDERITDELLRTQRVLRELTGRTPEFFRPPFGEVDARIAGLAAKAGLTTIQYDLPAGDSDKHATKDRLTQWVLRKAQPGGIVVLHINHPQFRTADALPGIIAGLRKRGFELVTVGTLLGAEPPPVCGPGRPEKPLPPSLAQGLRAQGMP